MGAESGVNWGHSQCPGNIIKGQKQSILSRAISIVQGSDIDMSAHTDAVIAAWETGLTTASDGTFVAPVDWEIRHEKFEANTAASLANLATAIGALSAKTLDVNALAPALASALNALNAQTVTNVDADAVAAALVRILPHHITLTGDVSA